MYVRDPQGFHSTYLSAQERCDDNPEAAACKIVRAGFSSSRKIVATVDHHHRIDCHDVLVAEKSY
jgi:hypothetical protein